jgi:hypothetical protein
MAYPGLTRMLPPLNEHGLLPEGIHDCAFEELESRFGGFQTSDRRPQLWAKFTDFFRQAKASRIVEALVLDGSFVTARIDPNDIDLIVIVFATHDFGADLPPDQYNLLAGQRVRRRFGIDSVVVKNGSDNLAHSVEFFAQVRQQPALKKGLLRLNL